MKFSCLFLPRFRQFSTTRIHATVRVRFAPSPTGFMHLGGLRTAMYNYFLARSCNGKFILRIEDTDQCRIVAWATENIIEALDWMEISPDEGPRYGGKYGPYIQSERLPFYQEAAEKLLESGEAYSCFCSPMRLELLRRQAVKSGEVPRYDNKCRSLSPSESQAKIQAGEPHVIRFRFENPSCTFDDEVFGPISSSSENEGDFVLMKSDGFPTYHFANVVDDHLMEISHVLRGVEWQISTPKHVALYSAFGWKPPKFAHLPLLLNADGSKLSKRKGALDILEFKKEGILPEALMGFLAQAGGGFRDQVAQTMVLAKKEDLIDGFHLSKVNRNSCRLDFPKLPELNKQALKRRMENPEYMNEFFVSVAELVKGKFGIQPTEEQITKAVAWISEDRLTSIKDLVAPDTEFLWRKPKLDRILSSHERAVVEKTISYLNTLGPEGILRDRIAKALRRELTVTNVDFKEAMAILRLVLTGAQNGPSVGEVMEVLGLDKCKVRLTDAVMKNK